MEEDFKIDLQELGWV